MMTRLRAFINDLRTPLYANAYALVANQVFSAGLGLVYWTLAARLYSAETYGASYAVISTLLLISGIAQLGLGGGMTRFLPRAGLQTRRLILMAYGVVIATSAVLSVGFVALGGALGLHGTLGSGPMVWVWVVSAAMLWSIFRLQDAVLIGLKQARWVLIENAVYNLCKLALLVVGTTVLANAGIVGSWFLPTPIVIVLVTWLVFGIFTRTSRIEPPAQGLPPLTIREIATTSGGDHIGSLVAEAAWRLLPLVIVAVLGTAATAYFSSAWLVATTLGLIAGAMTDSYTAEAAADRPNIARYSRDIMRHMALIVISAAAVLAIGAPIILTLFGKAYASQGTTLLRVLCVSSPLIVFNNWYLAYARVVGHIKQVIWIQSIGAALLLGLSYLLLAPFGVTGVGIAWMLAQFVVAAIGLFDSREIFFGDKAAKGGVSA